MLLTMVAWYLEYTHHIKWYTVMAVKLKIKKVVNTKNINYSLHKTEDKQTYLSQPQILKNLIYNGASTKKELMEIQNSMLEGVSSLMLELVEKK